MRLASSLPFPGGSGPKSPRGTTLEYDAQQLPVAYVSVERDKIGFSSHEEANWQGGRQTSEIN